MEPLTTFLAIMLYVLGIILLVVLIVLGVKLIHTVDTINRVVDDVEKKVYSLNGFFHIIDSVTDKMSLLSDRVVDVVSGLIDRVFRRRKTKEEDYYE